MADRTATAGPRLLLNAQSFGFGPAAAVAILADALAPLCGGLGYLGDGLTLDLQRRPPYAAVHDTTGRSAPERLALLRRLAPHYDLFVTAMDFQAAELALLAGLDVAVYDALTWYWPTLPASAQAAVLYLAQDFFGVRERIAADPALRERAVVVPPIIPARREWRPGGHVLLNLGGLQHPFWEAADAAVYGRLMVAAVRAAQTDGRPVVVATSREVAAVLGDPEVGTYDHATVLDLMSGASYACMTPGLGNIYDAAATGVPTCGCRPPTRPTPPRPCCWPNTVTATPGWTGRTWVSSSTGPNRCRASWSRPPARSTGSPPNRPSGNGWPSSSPRPPPGSASPRAAPGG
jgi:hypothetical protein